MATTIAHYEAKFQQIKTQKLPPQVVIDDLGNTISSNEYRAAQLSSLSQEIRRTCWNPETKKQSYEIAARADKITADLLGKVRSQPLPRFESFVSGGHIVPAIQ